MLLAYDINNQHASMITTGDFRITGEATLKVFDNTGNMHFPKSAILHCYFALVAADRSRQSESVYMGEIVFHPANPNTDRFSIFIIINLSYPETLNDFRIGQNKIIELKFNL